MRKALIAASILATLGTAAQAAPTVYTVDPHHTFPSIEVDHAGGLSILRGKFNRSAGKVVLDKAAQTGSVEITIDIASIDFGNDTLNEKVQNEEMLDVAKYPTATYHGTLTQFSGETPGAVEGQLTLHGRTRPVNLKIHQFLCKPSLMTKQEMCGADAEGEFDRSDFGVSYGKDHGFKQAVKLRIEIEAVKAD